MMTESFFTVQNLKAVVTLLILLAAIYSFVKEKISPDLTALLAVIALLLTGILTPAEAFAGFSHPATVSVAAVLVLSVGIEKTGALSFLARRLLLPLGHSELLLTGVIMLIIGFLSAFINNTAAVAVFIPIVLEVCRRTNISPGRVLMPMSHAATIGGMCSLVGTSTNLVAHEYARSQGLVGFSMFELGKVGIPMLIIGYAYMLFVGRLFLPKNESTETTSSAKTELYLSELIVADDSSWIGREINSGNFERDHNLQLIEVFRGSKQLEIEQNAETYQSGDSLRVRGLLEPILQLVSQKQVTIYRPKTGFDEPDIYLPFAEHLSENEPLKLAEVVVLTPSGLVGRTISEARFSETYDTIVVALKRRGEAVGRPSTISLHAGDILVVEGTDEALDALAESKGFLVISNIKRPEQKTGKVFITLLTLVGVILSVSLGLIPIVTAAVAGCAILILTKCLRLREMYRAIDMSIVVLLAGSLALGAALDKTGITTTIADFLTSFGGDVPQIVIIAAFLFAAIIISEFMSNSGTVPLLAPIAIAVASKTGINPMVLIALLLSVQPPLLRCRLVIKQV
ncbi:MAG: SLC13 family permease [Blastocatellia bacterium]|nr:SLC13 family permease [Blastocatellia bacterium]